MKHVAIAAAAAVLSTFASFGLSRVAPQPIGWGQIDLSAPYIPPARHRKTAAQRDAENIRMAAAKAKRARKQARNLWLVERGGLTAA